MQLPAAIREKVFQSFEVAIDNLSLLEAANNRGACERYNAVEIVGRIIGVKPDFAVRDVREA